jgi:hypothetical protein
VPAPPPDTPSSALLVGLPSLGLSGLRIGSNQTMRKVGRVLRWLLRACAVAGIVLAGVSVWRWQADAAEIRAIVGRAVADEASPSLKMRQALRFMVERVGYTPADDYFLLPVFRFLKPTALQIIRGTGGDCAYRARAFVVILHEKGVDATKLALYDARGEPVHAVVRVETENGPCIVDLLFDVIHEDEAGEPIPLARLSDPTVLGNSLRRAAEAGNARAGRYPIDKYGYHEVRTINWDKTGATRALFRAVAAVIGEERARALPRPHFSEEPAVMVALGGAALSAGCALCLGVGAWRRRRRERTRARRDGRGV